MTRRFAIATAALSATVAFLIGLIVAGSMTPTTAVSAVRVPERSAPVINVPLPADVVSFADVAEQLNPTVVYIDAASRDDRRSTFGGLGTPGRPDLFGRPFDRDLDEPRKGAGTGFIIDVEGFILTNHHVIEGAERIMVRLADGRHVRAMRVGSDPDTDIALVKIDASPSLRAAPLGDSDRLRVGEWVCAIGNPLAYEHTVTVGVVSFIGRKLFDTSLDRYIQTDAAINFGNSGGPLINARGEVIGINAAISSRASNIGFAIPINQARDVLPQLRDQGRVSRGYIGVTLKSVDQDLQRSLHLTTGRGALVQDVTDGSPAGRAGLQPYDVVTSVDDVPVSSDEELIREIASRLPGSVAHLRVVRDGRVSTVMVKLAERPARRRVDERGEREPAPDRSQAPALGLMVRDLDDDFVSRYKVPDDVRGVIVSAVEPMSPAFDAEIARGEVVLEINRVPVPRAADYHALVKRAERGDVLTFYLYSPDKGRRTLRAVRVDGR